MPKSQPFEQHLYRYESWFDRHPNAYDAELRAVKQLLPSQGNGVEIGVGTARFAAPLQIRFGVDPSFKMAKMARQRDIEVVMGTAENLPLKSSKFDFALMVTTVCFVDDIRRSFLEMLRILKPASPVIIGFVDRVSPLGQFYYKHKEKNVFYKHATFYSVDEIVYNLEQVGFKEFEFRQTIFGNSLEVSVSEPVVPGFGTAGFVVVKAKKPQ